MRLRVVVAVAAASLLGACTSPSSPGPESPSPSALTGGPEGMPLRVGEPQEGHLSLGSDPTWGMHGPFDLYRFQAGEGDRFLVEMSSSDFDSYLVIGQKSGGIFDPINEDDDSGGDLNARIRFTAPASGTYYVLAQAYSEYGEGGYVVSLDALAPPRPAVARSIPLGGMEEGELTGDDAIDEYDEKTYDLYTFEAQAGRRYAVTLRSDDFDTYLHVGRGTDMFEELASDDDSGGDTNSRVLFTATESGTHSIRATSFDGALGSYVVEVTELAAPGPLTITPIRMGQELTGSLDESDQISDDGSYYDVYRFTGREGQRVMITMSSADIDSYLELGEEADEFWSDYSDDDSGGNVDARINATLWRTGDFIIRASSFYPDAPGQYTIRVEEAPEPGPADVMPIEIGQTIEGSIDPDDGILEDDTYYDVYTFRATAGTRLSITLRSDDFDAFLAFGRWDNGSFEYVDGDDDSGGGLTGLDAQLQLTVPSTGTWAIQANTVGQFETGAYTLEVEEQ